MSRRVFSVSSDAQKRLGELRREMAAVEPESAEPIAPITDTLESLVEAKLKVQLTTLEGRDLGLAIMNSIRFLAVRARMPVAFGGELDQPLDEPTS